MAEDWISDFITFTEDSITTPMFRLWSAITAVSGACERRVWGKVGAMSTYPNLYVMLVANPGVGKYVINTVRELWYEAKSPLSGKSAFCVAPDNMTKASMIDKLAKAQQIFYPPSGAPYQYHSLLIAAEEFSVFMPAWDNEFIGVLNSIYNNPSVPYSEERRHGPAREVSIPHPNMSILAGVQPIWLGTTMPEEAWGLGLMTRMIMVYQNQRERKDIFAESEVDPALRAKLVRGLGKISTMYGQLKWEQDGYQLFRDWYLAGEEPMPTHSKLAHYVNRRKLHITKLAIISAVSRGSMIISKADIQRGMEWLFCAERLMPDIFRDMVGKSDFQLIEEMHYFAMQYWASHKRQPVPESVLIEFLRARCPSEKIDKIMDIAERSNVLKRVAGTTTYMPQPKTTHGME